MASWPHSLTGAGRSLRRPSPVYLLGWLLVGLALSAVLFFTGVGFGYVMASAARFASDIALWAVG